MLHQLEERSHANMLSVVEAGRQLGLSPNATRKITKGRNGCHRYLLPGSKKPTIKIEQWLVDEILTQSDGRRR